MSNPLSIKELIIVSIGNFFSLPIATIFDIKYENVNEEQIIKAILSFFKSKNNKKLNTIEQLAIINHLA